MFNTEPNGGSSSGPNQDHFSVHASSIWSSIFSVDIDFSSTTSLHVLELLQNVSCSELSFPIRPIWYQDEQRLLWSTSVCTASLRDRALIRVMASTGARAHDISLHHKQQHVEEKLDHAGEPAIMLLINTHQK